MWPSARTAILVIHGVGQQNPFDTLDGFLRTLAAVLKDGNEGSTVTAAHHLLARGKWTESYVSLVKDGNQSTAIDVFEYYWAHETERQIDIKEIYGWLIRTSDAARRFYEQNQQLVETYEEQKVPAFGKTGVVIGRRKFKKYWYMKYAGIAFRIGWLLANARIPHPVAAAAVRAVSALVQPVIVGCVGDVAIYTTTDRKSKHYEIRQRILDGAVDKMEALLKSATPEPEYDSIILVGHSLGSVIAYDALNRLIHRMNVALVDSALGIKLKGLVTLGSPLDKIAFFFRGRASEHQIVKRQILSQFHVFKAKNWDPVPADALQLLQSVKPYLSHMWWLNFWDPKDPLGGHLDFYDVSPLHCVYCGGRLTPLGGHLDFYVVSPGGNRRVETGAGWGAAHTAYWDHRPMYEAIVQTLTA